MKSFTVVRLQFVGFHRYKNTPKEVKFLRNYHRHIFHVEVVAEESFPRELEFFLLKSKVCQFLKKYENKYFDDSCEDIALDILNHFDYVNQASVFEDNENGAVTKR